MFKGQTIFSVREKCLSRPAVLFNPPSFLLFKEHQKPRLFALSHGSWRCALVSRSSSAVSPLVCPRPQWSGREDVMAFLVTQWRSATAYSPSRVSGKRTRPSTSARPPTQQGAQMSGPFSMCPEVSGRELICTRSKLIDLVCYGICQH